MLVLSTDAMIAINSGSSKSLSLYQINYQDVENGPILSLFYTNYSEDVMYNSNLYKTFPILHGDMTQDDSGKANNVTMSIGNIDMDRDVQNILENKIVIGNSVIITQFMLDPDSGMLINSPIRFTFKNNGAKANKGQIDFQLTIGFDFLLSTVPNRRVFGKYCRWRKFKGLECKYSGSETECDRAFDTCKKFGNTLNFGGFPAIINQAFYF